MSTRRLRVLEMIDKPFLGGGQVHVLTVAAARVYFHARLGGVTGDCLGAACQISETVMLLIFVCLRFI